ncbi:DUF935 family protein [Dysgonomonas sp. ZJ709]|uniref:phage portal protein family protein n=1 Tax=Dysgonomonas sp. ZJ709 TaxID=2709797 RepID=UPI0013ED577C|nr:DUF935 family protein [Dysgonomonas sp. ZJ709]
MAKELIKGKEAREMKKTTSVSQNIVVRPSRIETTDISTWRNAVNNAKTGNRRALYNLYGNILADPFLRSAVGKFVGAVTNAEIAFQKDGESVEAIDDLIDTPEFEMFLKEIVLSFIWGKSVIECSFFPDFSVFSVPRKNILIKGFDKPLSQRQKYIIDKEGDQSGYDFTKNEFILECGDDDDLGLLYIAAPYVIYKRGGFGDWAQFVELFGMPFRLAKYNSFDTGTRDKLIEFLSSMGGAPYAAVPKEADFEVLDNKSSGSNDIYKGFRDACNEEILIGILRNTMTTINGSSKSQAEVHQLTEEGVYKELRRFVQRKLNRWFVPLLVKRGYDVAGGFFSFPEAGESISTKERVEIALKLKEAGIKVDDDYLYEITGIPKSDTKDTTKEKEETAPEQTEEKPKEEKPKEPDKTEEKLSDERNFVLKLFDRFFVHAPTTWSGAFQNLSGKLKRSITGKITLADDGFSINIDKLINEALRDVYGNKGQELVNQSLFDITNNALQQGIDNSLTVQDADEDFVRQFKENAAVFSAFKNHLQTKEIAALLHDENGKLRSFYKFKKLALQISEKYNVQWLLTEYNMAVRSALMAADMKQ